MKQPLVSIIILNHNGMPFIEKCLNSILKSRYLNKEIIVVDSMSPDGSGELVKRKYALGKNLRLLEVPRYYGTDRARNVGVVGAQGEYLIFLDNDTEVDSAWIDEFVKIMEKDKSIGAAQSKLLKIEPRDEFDCAGDFLGPLGFLIERSRGAKDVGQLDYVAEVLSAKSASSIIRSKIFKQIGGFDEDFFKYLEETDLCWRVWLAGYRVVFVPKSKVYHAFNTPRKDSKRYYPKNIVKYYGCRNYILTLVKNLEIKNLIKILPLHICCWLSLSILFVLKGNFADSYYILKGIGWNFFNINLLLKKRQFINSNIRKVSDQEILGRIMDKKKIDYYLGKAFAYLTGRPF